jgi:hypothetical protein
LDSAIKKNRIRKEENGGMDGEYRTFCGEVIILKPSIFSSLDCLIFYLVNLLFLNILQKQSNNNLKLVMN